MMCYQGWSQPLATYHQLWFVSSAGARPNRGRSAELPRHWGRPRYIRFAHERSVPGLLRGRRNERQHAGRLVHDVASRRDGVEEEGTTNVRWVSSPEVNYGEVSFVLHYPGGHWAGWLDLDGCNWARKYPFDWCMSLSLVVEGGGDFQGLLPRRSPEPSGDFGSTGTWRSTRASIRRRPRARRFGRSPSRLGITARCVRREPFEVAPVAITTGRIFSDHGADTTCRGRPTS